MGQRRKGDPGKKIQTQVIEDLAKIFKIQGKALSRREYLRLGRQTHTLELYESIYGWGEAKKLAAAIAFAELPAEPEKPKAMARAEASRSELLDRAPLTLAAADPDLFENKLALMAGLKRTKLPERYREMIARLVMETERCLSTMRPVPLKAKSGAKETAILLISDIHAGKQVYDDQGRCLYNRDICAFRLAILRDKVTKLLKDHVVLENVDEFVICLIGDIVDGSGIYPGQELNQDITGFSNQISLVTAAIWDLVKKIRSYGLPVRIKAVRGNHGRQYKYAPAQNNFDYLVYQMLAMFAWFEDREGVDVEYATTTDYLNFEVKGYNCHMRHEAPVQPETAASRAKFGGWRAIHDWSFFFFGHKHHPGHGTYLDGDTYMNGSPIGMDDFAESLALFSRPSQTLLGVDPDVGASFCYNVYLDQFGEGGEADRLLKKYPALKTV